MASSKTGNETNILEMALVGYQVERQKIEERIQEIQAALKGKQVALHTANGNRKPAGVRRALSPAARRRIALAQRKRWAAYRKSKAGA